jgi:hypothetical protein
MSIATLATDGNASTAVGRTLPSLRETSFSGAAKDARASHRKDASGCRNVGEAKRLEVSLVLAPRVLQALPLASD